MIELDTIPYNILRETGLSDEEISASLRIIDRTGVDNAREASFAKGRAAAALMELERRLDGEIIGDFGSTAMGPMPFAPARTSKRAGCVFRSRIILAEGIMLHGDTLILHGTYARTLPNGVLASRAGRPVTDTIDHPALQDLLFADQWEAKPEATVIKIEQGTISFPTGSPVARIRSTFRSISYIRPVMRETRGKKALAGQRASLVITAVTIAALLAGQASPYAVGFIVLTFFAILRDTVFPTRGDMQAFLRTTRDKFPKM